MITLNKVELLSYKNSLLVSFTPDAHTPYKGKNLEGLLAAIYTCIIKRKYSGTAQEKIDIANMGRTELAAVFNLQK